MNEQETKEYLNALQPGESVVETGDNCMIGAKGTVYIGKLGEVCVMWENKMGTSVTWGTRRISDNIIVPSWPPPLPDYQVGQIVQSLSGDAQIIAIKEQFGQKVYTLQVDVMVDDLGTIIKEKP